MFLRESVELDIPYLKARARVLEQRDRLGALARIAVEEALEAAYPAPPDALPPSELRVPSVLRCQIGPIRLLLDSAAISMRWNLLVDSCAFPPVLDADLRLNPRRPESSELTIDASFATPEKADAQVDLIHRTTVHAIRRYLHHAACALAR